MIFHVLENIHKKIAVLVQFSYIFIFIHYRTLPYYNKESLFWTSSKKGKLASDQTLKCSGQARSKGKALLFLTSKQNLNPSDWRITNCQKQSKIEPDHPKNSLDAALILLEFKDDL
jgi:hypothetical protein